MFLCSTAFNTELSDIPWPPLNNLTKVNLYTVLPIHITAAYRWKPLLFVSNAFTCSYHLFAFSILILLVSFNDILNNDIFKQSSSLSIQIFLFLSGLCSSITSERKTLGSLKVLRGLLAKTSCTNLHIPSVMWYPLNIFATHSSPHYLP